MNKMTYLELANVLVAHNIKVLILGNDHRFICERYDNYYIEHKKELYDMPVVYCACYSNYIEILLREA